jgi:3-keto-5-aminohexanoate cleavage enzyme
MVPTKADNPAVPLAPAEIAEDCRRCAAAGATMIHVHARDAEGRATYHKEVFRETIALVRATVPEIVVCVTTSGRVFGDLEQRAEVLDLDGPVKPDMASLTLGSMNFPREVSVNAPNTIQALAGRMRERGIVPELEVFDIGMLDYARYLIDRGILGEPFYFNFLLGSLGTLAATPLHLAQLAAAVPTGATWAAAGIGRFQLSMNALAVAMGGHVRVGLEDNLFLDTAKQNPATNLSLVERVVGIAHAMGRPVATCAETRRRIGLGDPPRA